MAGQQWRAACYAVQVNVTQIIEELRLDQAHIQEAIMSLERLASGRGRRRGRLSGLAVCDQITHTGRYA